ncbi:MAG: hypothetical protein R3F17_12275 [Planctomycetota bacterium]
MHLYRHIQNLPAGYFDQADTGTSCAVHLRRGHRALVPLDPGGRTGRALLLVGCALPILFQLDVRLAWISLAVVPVLGSRGGLLQKPGRAISARALTKPKAP